MEINRDIGMVYTPILDGGSLLHRIVWPSFITYGHICQLYCTYVQRKYGTDSYIGFDGYPKLSTKANTHWRRKSSKSSVPVQFSKEMVLPMTKEVFMSNKINTTCFTGLLGETLSAIGCKIFNGPGDADLLIIQTVIEVARQKNVGVHGGDTDLLVLILFHINNDSKSVFFLPKPCKPSSNPKVWCINRIKAASSPEITKSLLFWHGMLGCDTSSILYGIGKGATYMKHYEDP
jgi:hypothetical protein